MKDPQRILVIRTDRIGDVILTTPAILNIRAAYPDAHLAVLTAPLTEELLQGIEGIDEVIVDDKKGAHSGFAGFLRLLFEISSKNFDTVFVFHQKKRTNLLAYFAGIQRRIGFKSNKFGFLLNEGFVDNRHLGDKHEAEYCLDLLRHVGIKPESCQPTVTVYEEEETWADKYFQQNNISSNDRIVAIHVGASDPAKCWPIDCFGELVQKIHDRYQAKIFLIGSVETRSLARQLYMLSDVPLYDLTGMTTLRQLTALFKKCHLLISNDSGPVHLAVAVDTSVVSIFTRNQPGINPERWSPLSPNSRFVSVPRGLKLTDFGVDEKDFKKSTDLPKEYLKYISVDKVLESVDAALKVY